ncbi:MAG: serine/threonine-protein kinase [Acidimicrobiales bacterium]
MSLPTSATADIGGRYRIEGPLGRGGMAEVRAGTDLRLQRPVAVKFLLPEMAAREDIRLRFEAEARTAASLTDPHAVAVYDTGEHDGLPYIVMERLPGETLADRIAGGPRDPAWVRRVAREVLGALGAAHAAGLVHRDVKPGNILLTADGHAKIADFGIAKSLEGSEGALDLTGTGQLLGTPAYLPPERLDGGLATAQSDLYSLGVVLYEALTGETPFPGLTPVATAMAIVAGHHRPLDEARPGLEPALVVAVDRAMATDPEQRYASAVARAAALAERAPTVALAGADLLVPAAAAAGPLTAIDGSMADGTAIDGSMADGTLVDQAQYVDTAEVGVAPPPPTPTRRSLAPLAIILGILFVAVLIAALNSGGAGAPNQPVPAQVETSTTAPATTVAPAEPPATVARQPTVTVPAPAAGKDDKPANGKGKGKDD